MATLTALIASVRSRVDRTGSSFVSDAEITGWLNEGLAELWDIVTSTDQDYVIEQDDVAIVAGTSSYDLSTFDPEILRVRGVTLQISGANYTLAPCSIRERDHDQAAFVVPSGCVCELGSPHGSPYRYRLSGDSLVITPEPRESSTATVFYTPKPTALVTGPSTTDASLQDHWLKYAIYSACVEVRDKEEEDSSSYAGKKNEIERRIKKAIRSRTTDPKRVVDVNNGGWGYGQ
jgi:hypothetical protein